MLERVTHIEGLDVHEDHELFDDTPPGAVQVRFDVVSEEMPFETSQSGRTIRKNFVYIFKTWELGRSSFRRRIRDKVSFNEATGKWVIHKLGANGQSDIRTYPSEWNAFMRGTSQEDFGTPLSLLFKNDPSRVELYRSKHVKTVEQLSSLPESSIQELGMGAREEVAFATQYLEQTKKTGAAMALKAELDQQKQANDSLRSQVADLSAKLTELLNREVEELSATPKKKLGRPRKVISEVAEQLGE